jgi:hypothetical protein
MPITLPLEQGADRQGEQHRRYARALRHIRLDGMGFAVRPPSTDMACRLTQFDKSKFTQRTMLPAVPTYVIRSNKCLLFTLSKTPLKSRSSARAIRFLAPAFSTFTISWATASDMPIT